MHVGLTMLASDRVVELEGSKTSTRHQEERDVLDVLDFLRVCVLSEIACVRSDFWLGTGNMD